MTYAAWNSVLAPKVTGTWNLHDQLEKAQLNFFVLASSLSCVVGRPGQASYSAANSFLQSFSHYRRSLGLPCSVVDIGAVEDVGYTSRHLGTSISLRGWRYTPVQQEDFLNSIEISIRNSRPCRESKFPDRYVDFGQITTGMHVSDNGAVNLWDSDARLSRFQEADREHNSSTPGSISSLQHLLHSAHRNPQILQDQESLSIVTFEVSQMLQTLLVGSESDIVDDDRPLSNHKLDSLVRIEIRNWWKNILGIDIHVLDIMKLSTVSAMGKAAIAMLQEKYTTTQASALPEEDRQPGSANNLILKHDRYVQNVNRELDEFQLVYDPQKPEQLVVFLTGATGFLGLEITRQLLQDVRIDTLVVLLRDETSDQGLQRLIKAGTVAGWWRSDYTSKLEVWLGDLSKDGFGINAEQLGRLQGTSHQRNVDVIMHNGAIVDFLAPYRQLSAANVGSVVSLLKIAASSKKAPRFIYISGGLKKNADEPYDVHIRKNIQLPGYFQSKMLAESVVMQFAKLLPASQNRICILKPGLVIGRTSTPKAQEGHLLWRVLKSCLQVGIYPVESERSWLPIQIVDAVAQNIVAQVFAQNVPFFIDMMDGVVFNEFVDICNVDLPLWRSRIPMAVWNAEVMGQITEDGIRHPLYPLRAMVTHWPTIERKENAETDNNILLAIRENVRHLKSTGSL